MENKNKKISIFVLSVFILTQISVFVPQSQVSASVCDIAYCGDGACDSTCGESNTNCNYDCSGTPNPVSNPTNCDIAYCGDGSCSCGESVFNCSYDCQATPVSNPGNCDLAYCGDGSCNCGESVFNCSYDCSTSSSTPPTGCDTAYCGDGTCSCNETSLNCSHDCSSNPCDTAYCGDGLCNCNETPLNCSYDCQATINDAVFGTLTVSSNAACVGKTISVTLDGQDDNGMVELKLMIDNSAGAREDTLVQNCSGTQCLKTWDITKNVAGFYKMTAKFFGQRPDGTQEVYSIDDRYIEYRNCPAPTVDIKAASPGGTPSDGPVTIPFNTSANLTWTANNADSCTATGDWSGSKSLTGSQSTGNLITSKTYTIICTGSGGTAQDSVTVNVSSAPTPTVDIKANGSDGPVTITFGTSVNLNWTSQNASTCTATGAWSGSKSPNGSEQTGVISSDKTYTIACTGSGGTAQDSVTVRVSDNHPPVANAGPDKEIFETESVILEGSGSDPDGDAITYHWTCNGGVLSDANIAQPRFFGPIVTTSAIYMCTLTVTDSRGAGDSDSTNILVKEHHCLELSVSLLASPNSGCAPLNNVDLTATVSGSASGTVIYYFDCQNDGVWEKIETRNDSVFTALDLCSYPAAGNYTAKIRVQREGLSNENTAQVSVQSCAVAPTVDLKVNGFDGSITIANNTSATLSWTSANANSCTASGGWSGSRSLSGAESTGNLTSSKTYTIICTGDGGTAADTVSINVTGQGGNNLPPVANAGPDKEVFENLTVNLDGSGFDPDGGSVTYSWTCNGGTLSQQNIAQPTYFAPNVFQNTYYICTLLVTDDEGMSASDQMNVKVLDQTFPSPNISVSLSANPSSGCAPLNGVDLTANVFGTFTGQYNTYYFDCNISDGIGYDRISSLTTDNSFTAFDVCNYSTAGTYTARVRVDRQGQITENTVQISVSSCFGGTATVNKTVRNLSSGGVFSESIIAKPGDVLTFSIAVTSGNTLAQNVIVRDIMPSGITWRSNSLKVDGILTSGDIISGLNIGTMSALQTRTITFDADIAGQTSFNFGNTQLVNTATIFGTNISGSDTAQITVNRAAVAGAATGVSTGWANNIWLDSFLIPLAIALFAIFAWRSNIFGLEQWYDQRKKRYQEFKTDKVLQTKIAKARLKDFLSRNV